MIRKSRWEAEKPSWLKEDEFHADPLGDFVTRSNTISVWRVEDDKSNLRRLVTALAANRDKFDIFESIIFDEKLLSVLDIKVQDTEGDTPDK